MDNQQKPKFKGDGIITFHDVPVALKAERVLKAAGKNAEAAVLADHPVPIAIGKHTRVPVPVAVRKAGLKPDGVTAYDEISCKAGRLGNMKGPDFMNLLFEQERPD